MNRANAPQNYRTPPELLDAVQARFGKIDFDLACTLDDSVALAGYHHPEYDALERDWAEEIAGATCWCNPPFGKSKQFAQKANQTIDNWRTWPSMGGRILLLTPASVGSTWFATHVHGQALVLALSPRVTFVGQTTAINRDLILSVYGPDIVPGFEPWRWKT